MLPLSLYKDYRFAILEPTPEVHCLFVSFLDPCVGSKCVAEPYKCLFWISEGFYGRARLSLDNET